MMKKELNKLYGYRHLEGKYNGKEKDKDKEHTIYLDSDSVKKVKERAE